ncbi:DUF3231 family protein [Halobacillus hunanensis]|uniref:DUF3231 family protein n=1 Tax=Halobacillus hunanensis TaxID=578214 RepID=UPI0009A8ABA8|nr:DUF3231 family protein [Halobacillus hunanensis]
MDINHQPELTSAEVSALWTSYVQGTMIICGLKYFLAKVEDPDISAVLSYAMEIMQQQVDTVKQIFEAENYPIPYGFTEDDVNENAPRLFSDTFFLVYILNMAKFTLAACGLAAGTSTRLDIVNFYKDCLDQSQELHIRSKKIALEKGIYVRPPHIPKPSQVDFVTNQSFLTGWVGKRRPLLGIEITNIVTNIKRNAIGKALIIGFSQVASSKEVRKYMERGRDIAQKHVKVFSTLLNKEYLPVPRTWDHTVTDSTVAPFSDKLMMFHISALIASGMGQYGMSMSVSPRRDLGLHYVRLSAEIAMYSEDGANIMINNGWLEQPPIAVDRKALARKKG